jgi:hypothetical protein
MKTSPENLECKIISKKAWNVRKPPQKAWDVRHLKKIWKVKQPLQKS